MLSDLLSILDRDSHLFVIRRTGSSAQEAIFYGTAKQLLHRIDLKMFVDFPVDLIEPDVWPEENALVLIATVGMQKER